MPKDREQTKEQEAKAPPRKKKASKKKSGPTPVMKQFFAAKSQYPDAILFFRMGDFYEMFYDDAILASELLGITLTARNKSAEGEKIPMAGVPHHAAAGYLAQLLKLGQSVAVCEQMADPKTVKGVVPRAVTRVVTPGICLEDDAIDARTDNTLAAVAKEGDYIAVATFDISAGQLRYCSVSSEAEALAELVRLEPRELLVDTACQGLAAEFKTLSKVATRPLLRADDATDMLTPVQQKELDDVAPAVQHATRAILQYAQSTQPSSKLLVQRLQTYDPNQQLVLDDVAVRNLELVSTTDGQRKGSLLHLLDATKTPMGARLLRRRLLAPLTDLTAIRKRLALVTDFFVDGRLRDAVVECLSKVADLERLATRVSMSLATPRDLVKIRDTLNQAQDLVKVMKGGPARPDSAVSQAIPKSLCLKVAKRLSKELMDEAPATYKQGQIFREGVDKDLDDLRNLASKSKDIISALEARERKRTGVASLKVKYTRVFGYYIEITRSNLGSVPKDYVRKQTVANAERFTTEELTELQDKIAGAEEKSKQLEAQRFEKLVLYIAESTFALRDLATQIARLDVSVSQAEVARRWGYVCPQVDTGNVLDIKEGRHPIVERLAADGNFVPNDVMLDTDGERLMVVTGPNMSGKSTVMRQVALAVIMAQSGGYVPASSAQIGVVDRIFTRVGASDSLSRGQSTFMVEMKEAATILRSATAKSLVILDEIGRGTSTYDGVAIAWAVAEHLHDAIKCRAMFATHYHELCELAHTRPSVVNYSVAAREYKGEVVFLHKLTQGPANRSYGIAVAQLAGVPGIVLARAKAILGDLEGGASLPSGSPARLRPLDKQGRAQLDLFAAPIPQEDGGGDPTELEQTLKALSLDHMTPVEALVALSRLKGMLD